MTDVIKHMVIPRDGETEMIYFTADRVTSITGHWQRHKGNWHFEKCDVTDCKMCIAGENVQQRFTFHVVNDGVVKKIEIPRPCYLLVQRFQKKLKEKFTKTLFVIGRDGRPTDTHWILEEAD